MMREYKKTKWSFGFRRETETYTVKKQRSLYERLFGSSTAKRKAKKKYRNTLEWLLDV